MKCEVYKCKNIAGYNAYPAKQASPQIGVCIKHLNISYYKRLKCKKNKELY